MQVDCGKCNFCLSNRRGDWSFRMLEEDRHSHTSYFITLTYDDKHVPRVRDEDGNVVKDSQGKPILTLKKKHLYRFLKTLKQKQNRFFRHKDKAIRKQLRNSWRIKYYAVGEYGSEQFTTRPHYHLIVFNLHPNIAKDISENKIWTKSTWPTDISLTEQNAPGYCAKYIIDRAPHSEDDPRETVFSTMSRNPGIGIQYLERNRDWHRAPGTLNPDEFRIYRMENGFSKRLPRYYVKKLRLAEREDRQQILNEAFEIYYKEAKEKFERDYKKEIERLRVLGPYPELAYIERIKFQHDQIRIKSLNKRKL